MKIRTSLTRQKKRIRTLNFKLRLRNNTKYAKKNRNKKGGWTYYYILEIWRWFCGITWPEKIKDAGRSREKRTAGYGIVDGRANRTFGLWELFDASAEGGRVWSESKIKIFGHLSPLKHRMVATPGHEPNSSSHLSNPLYSLSLSHNLQT